MSSKSMTSKTPERTRAAHTTGAIEEFLAGFDLLRGSTTDPAPLVAAWTAPDRALQLAFATPFANLRSAQYRLLGPGDQPRSTRPRTVANRPKYDYADSAVVLDLLDEGSVLLQERPDLLAASCRLGLDALRGDIDDGHLSVVALHVLARGQTVHFDAARARHLVLQLAGTSEWGTRRSDGGADAGPMLVGPGGCASPCIEADDCRPMTDGVLVVLAHLIPTVESLRAAVAADFLQALADDAAQDIHHLVVPRQKAAWVRDRLEAYITQLGSRHPEVDLLNPTSRRDTLTVETAAGKHGSAISAGH